MMNNLERSLLASLMLSLALPAIAAPDLPFILTGVVRNAADGTSAEGMRWTAWSDAAPATRVSGRLGDGTVGAVRPGAFYGDIGTNAADAGGQWTVVVQGRRANRTYVAVSRGTLASHPAVFEPATLAVLPSMVVGVDLGQLGGGWRPIGHDGGPVVGPGEALVPGRRIHRVSARSSAPTVMSLCPGDDGAMQVVDGTPSGASCLPLLTAPSTGTGLSR